MLLLLLLFVDISILDDFFDDSNVEFNSVFPSVILLVWLVWFIFCWSRVGIHGLVTLQEVERQISRDETLAVLCLVTFLDWWRSEKKSCLLAAVICAVFVVSNSNFRIPEMNLFVGVFLANTYDHLQI